MARIIVSLKNEIQTTKLLVINYLNKFNQVDYIYLLNSMSVRLLPYLTLTFITMVRMVGFAQSALDEIKPFDPVNMNSQVSVDLDSYYFVAENKFFALRPGFFYGLPNGRHFMGLSIPVVHSIFSGDFAGYENTTGIGDIKLSYIGVPYQSNDVLGFQRISAFLDVTAPTGSETLGRGVGAWVYKPGLLFYYRPDVAFHIYPQVNIQFSVSDLNSLGGGDGLPDLEDPEEEERLQIISASLPATFAIDSWAGWVSFNPEYTYSFSEETYFLFLRLDFGKMMGKRSAAALQVTKFIAGQPRLETLVRVRFNFYLADQR